MKWNSWWSGGGGGRGGGAHTDQQESADLMTGIYLKNIPNFAKGSLKQY
jgi:hypothetical protein